MNCTCIEKYGIILSLLTNDKIELVRKWRNDPKVSQYMEYRKIISSEQQKKWFNNINNGKDNFYWIIKYKDEEIGLINIKDVDYEKLTGESGVFIYSDKYLSTDISYRAHLAMFDYIFNIVGLEMVYCHILKTNIRAQRFTLYIGMKKADGQENIENQLYILTKNEYFNNINRIRFIDKYNKLSNK